MEAVPKQRGDTQELVRPLSVGSPGESLMHLFANVDETSCLELIIMLVFHDFINVILYEIWFIPVGRI